MVAARNYQYQHEYQRPQRRPQPRPQRVTERERQRRVASKAERLLAQQKAQERQRKAAARARYLARQRRLRQARTIAFVCAIFALLMVTLGGYAIVTEARVQLNRGQADLKTQLQAIKELETEAMALTDISVIKQKAEERLNMGLPEDYQVVSVQSQSSAVADGGGLSLFDITNPKSAD
ncbi:hypothetical protein LJC20_05180 [Eubacteriales bacterium OttesenSCG-928-M02]|nr:hypothetical protein [Eubacteriales bacterium OttesenSCG-928-M02]